jgi:hypothetical protein
MSSGDTVPRRRLRRLPRQPIRDARVRVLTRNVPDAFADIATSAVVSRMVVLTPWITDEQGGCVAFGRLVSWSARCGAALQLITRPPDNSAHMRAVHEVLNQDGGRVLYNRELHAKVFIAVFEDTRRVAVVGSSNLTAGSAQLLETAVMVHSPRAQLRRGPDVIDDLLAGPVRQAVTSSSRVIHAMPVDSRARVRPQEPNAPKVFI